MSQTDNEKIEKMIKENEKLIYFVYNKLSKNVYTKRNEDELCGAGLVGLWKGCKTYDESKKMKLSTYLCKCIKNEMLQFLRSQNLMKDEIDRNALRFESPVKKGGAGGNITVGDTIYYNQDFFGCDINEYVEIYFKYNPKTKPALEKIPIILEMLAREERCPQIAEKTFLSRTMVYVYIHKIRDAILKEREMGEQ